MEVVVDTTGTMHRIEEKGESVVWCECGASASLGAIQDIPEDEVEFHLACQEDTTL